MGLPLPSKVIHVRDQLGVEGGGRGDSTPWPHQLYSVLVLETRKRERVRQGRRGEGRGREGRRGEGRGREGMRGEGRGREGRRGEERGGKGKRGEERGRRGGEGGEGAEEGRRGHQDTLEFLQEGRHISTLLQPLKGREREWRDRKKRGKGGDGYLLYHFLTATQDDPQLPVTLQPAEWGEKRGRGGRRRREREEEGRRITMLTAEPQVHGSHLASLSCPEGGVVIAIR